ncbi:NAD(P)/FAD-dependent oxidoreductase [Halodurantibacterium flavum]|uniref:NAD(P)/FAD-dependent oxidoreductase n=1 Tax=Halodurantibacterium flavum TaxID=1382802 RepID=A0ABW4S4E4_9RHOB
MDPMHLYEPEAYDPRWPDSHWAATVELPPPVGPLTGESRTDVAVIGAGYAGLSAARELARRGLSVTVVDAAQPGWGASGRNGGFCCMGGSKLSDAQIARRFGLPAARAFRRFQREAVEHVAETLQTEGIDADQGPWGEYLLAHRPSAYRALVAGATELRDIYDEAPRLIPREELAGHGISPHGFHGAMLNPVGFPLHPLKYALGLARAAQAAGAVLHGDSAVTGMMPDGTGWRMVTAQGVLRARRVLIATNGYSREDLPGWIGGRLMPVISAIFVTRPLTEAERDAQGWTTRNMSFDTRDLLHYFRLLPDNRFMFGMRGGLSARPRALERLHDEAEQHLAALFPAWAGIEVERHWSGLACLTGSLAPYAGPVPGMEGVFAALGWHGNGVAAASLTGHRIASEIAQGGAGKDATLPEVMRRIPPRLPFPAFRRRALGVTYRLLSLKDGPLPR